MKGIIPAIILATLSVRVWGDVYKCMDASGATTYRDTRCPDTTGRVMRLPAAPTGLSASRGLRKDERAWLQQIERTRQSKRQKMHASRTKMTGSEQALNDAILHHREMCHRYKMKIKEIDDEMRRGYRASRGAILKDKRNLYSQQKKYYCS